MARIDREELRGLVRQALKDALGTRGDAAASPPAAASADLAAALGAGKPARVSIAVRSGADLERFAREVALAAGKPDVRAAILAGEIRFDLAGEAKPAGTKPAAEKSAAGAAFQMQSGVLSEAKIVSLAKTHRRIVVGNDVVMTPLARDKAREMKVELVRQKP